jgi:uncharacterized membrane protein YecN with MAPEG domain
MVSVLYVCICAVIVFKLSLNVVRLRRLHKVSLGDGRKEDLRRAIRAHGNATEYMPITLLLLFGLEFNQAPLWLVHLAGITFVAGRAMHAFAMPGMVMPRRVLGMQITATVIITLVVANLVFLPYGKLLG